MLVAGASLLALVLLVVGVPLLLWSTAGSPFAHWDVPALQSVASHGPLDASAAAHWLGRAALAMAWLAWVWMAVCIVIELRGWITGRAGVRLPASRTFQSVAACLVGAVLAVGVAGRSHPGTVGPLLATPSITSGTPLRVIDHLDPYWGIDDEQGRSQVRPPAEGSSTAVAGWAWPEPQSPPPPAAAPATGAPEVRRTDADPGSGTVATRRDPPPPEWASGPRRPGAPRPGNRSARLHEVGVRETLWSIARDELGSSTRWREIAELNYGRQQPDGGALDRRHWTRPGWVLRLPDDDRPVLRVDRGWTGPAAPPSDDRGGDAHSTPPRSSAQRAPGPPQPLPSTPFVPLVPFGTGVVAQGVVGILERMRRAQFRHRRPGELIRLPWTGNRVEQRLRATARSADLDEIDAAVAAAVTADLHGVRPVLVRLRPDVVEVMFELPRQPPSEVAGPSQAPAAVVLDRAAVRAQSPRTRGALGTPPNVFVSAGTVGGDLVMVDLVALQSVAVTGDLTSCNDFVRALALELATSRWAGRFGLSAMGLGHELARFPHVSADEDTDALLAGLRRGETPRPHVVVLAAEVPTEVAERAVQISADAPAEVVVVAAGSVPSARHQLVVTDRPSGGTMELLGWTIAPQQIGADDVAEVAALLDEATVRRSVPRTSAPYDTLTVRLPRDDPDEPDEPDGPDGPDPSAHDAVAWRRTATRASEASPRDRRPAHPSRPAEAVGVAGWRHGPSGSPPGGPEDEPEIEVCVLGPIEIRGALRPFTRAWAEELVVYLAMHPRGASNETWATALWPDRLMAPSSLHSTASVARRSLGQSRTGEDHLPRSHGRLRLAPTVGTDWDRFVAGADEATMASWRAALALVRGRPFEGLRASDWPVLEGVAPAIEAAVVDLAGRLAGASLRAGDPGGAEWAARQGLLASPYDERLYRMLMRAADAAGNPAGVASAMGELLRLVADDVEPFDAVHPTTWELYRSLVRGRGQGQGQGQGRVRGRGPARIPRATAGP